MKKMNLLICFLIFICFSTVWAKDPIDVYGDWAVTRVKSVGGGSSSFKSSVGKVLRIKKDRLECNQSFFFLKKGVYKNTLCEWKSLKLGKKTNTDYDEDVDRLPLYQYGFLDEEYKDHAFLLTILFGKQPRLAFELTKNNELATYFDGSVIFFKKVEEKK